MVLPKICPGCQKEYQPKTKIQKCCSRVCSELIRENKSTRENRVNISCDFKISPKCKDTWEVSERFKERTFLRNNGKYLCLYCSRALKSSGRNNPNTKYFNMDDNFFSNIDTEHKAYFLGWIASDGHVSKTNTIVIKIHLKDKEILTQLKNSLDPDLPVKINLIRKEASLSLHSQQMVSDVCRLLSIVPGKKSHVVEFPEFIPEELKRHFIRGYFDGDGCVLSPSKTTKSPRCSLSSSSEKMLKAIRDNSKGSICRISGKELYWSGNSCLDFLSFIYEKSSIKLNRKYDLYLMWSSWIPSLSGSSARGSTPTFTWSKTRKDAVEPLKSRASDSGFDITILEPYKKFGENTVLYHTGIKVRPEFGWYLELVPRSSIIKTGYILSNCLGILDRTYTGEILVALTKIDPNAPDLVLPNRIAQIIPRPIIHPVFIRVEDIEEDGVTERGSGGFGSTGVSS